MRNTPVSSEALTLLFLITASCCFISAVAEFTTSPGPLTVREGDTLTTNCSFTNADSLFWRKGDTVIETGDSFSVNLVDSDTSQLTLVPSADHTVHTGAYECVAVSGSDQSITEFSITVQYLSEAIVHVEPFECVEDGGNPYLGSQVTMRCTAEGDPLPQVTWFYNEVTPVLEKGNFTNVIYQQDNRTLIISPFRSFNWGHYHCQSENVIGQKSSNSILIGFQAATGNRKIEVVNDVNGIIFAPLGSFARIECQVLPPFPRINSSVETVVFREGTTTLQQGGGYNIIARPCNIFILIINDISSIHETQYQCTFGQDTASTNLIIARIIPTRLDLSSPVIGVGREVELNCSTLRRPSSLDVPQMLHFRFRAAGSLRVSDIIADSQHVIISRDEAAISANLTIREVELSDNGTYFCVAFNPDNLAVPVENKVDLIVEGRPVVTVTPPTAVVRVGTSLLLTCSISTERSSVFLWTINGLPITSSNASYTLTNPLPYQSVLNITSILPKDIGPINCSVEDPIHLPADEVVPVSEEMQPYIVGDVSGVTTLNVEINTTLSLNCDLRGMFTGTPTIQWFLGNRQLTNGSGVMVTGERSSSSTLTKSSVMDNATYRCIVRVGSDAFVMDFIVSIPPTFTDPSSSITTVPAVSGVALIASAALIFSYLTLS